MNAANRFKITRFNDYFVVRLGVSESNDKNELGELVAEVLLPLSTVASLSVDLFSGVIKCTGDLTQFFADLQPTLAALSTLSEQVNAKNASLKGEPDAKALEES